MKKRWMILACILCVASLLLLLSACGGKEAALVGEWKLEYAIDNESGEKHYPDGMTVIYSFNKDGTGSCTGYDENETLDFKWSVEENKVILRTTSYDTPQIIEWELRELSSNALVLAFEGGGMSVEYHLVRR